MTLLSPTRWLVPSLTIGFGVLALSPQQSLDLRRTLLVKEGFGERGSPKGGSAPFAPTQFQNFA